MNIRDVYVPRLVGRGRACKVTSEHVGRDGVGVVRVRRPHAELHAHFRADSQGFHDPRVLRLTMVLRCRSSRVILRLPWTPVTSWWITRICSESWRTRCARGLSGSLEPCVEACRGDLKDRTHDAHVEDHAVLRDVGELHGSVPPSSAAK